MLVIELRVGEAVRIGQATVTLEDKSGKVARLSIEASKDVPIQRVSQTTPAQMAKNGLAPMPQPA